MKIGKSNCVLSAVRGVTRRGDLRSWMRGFNLCVGDTSFCLVPPKIAKTIILVTDSYGGYSSGGLFSGIARMISKERELIKADLKLGGNIWLLRGEIPFATISNPRPEPEMVQGDRRNITIDEFDFESALPKGIVYCIRNGPA